MATKVKTYKNLKQLLDAEGKETPYQLGRSLYKYTDCGPWTSFVVQGEPARDEVEDVVIAVDPKTNKAKIESGNPSKDTLMVLGLDDPTGEAAKWPWKKYCEKLEKFVLEHNTIKRGYQPDIKLSVTNKSIARRWIRVERHVPAATKDFSYEDWSEENKFDLDKCLGIRIGSSVEGSDVEVGPVELTFPFTENEFSEAVESIDSEVSFYWERDNSHWYNLKDAKGTQYPFHDTEGKITWDEVPPKKAKKAAEKWAEDGGRWQKEDPKIPGATFETCEEGEWIPLPGMPGWTVVEYVNDCTF